MKYLVIILAAFFPALLSGMICSKYKDPMLAYLLGMFTGLFVAYLSIWFRNGIS